MIAVVVAFITVAVVANATSTLTVPNAASYSFSLGANGNMLLTPPSGRPVLIMGACTTVGYRGVAKMTVLVTTAAPLFVEWNGVESPAGAAITSGFSATQGTHMLFIDYAHQVDFEVNSATSIRIHNGAAAARQGVVTMIW